ncbi:MAG TPA: glycosyltransferase family 4 protein [Acidimicrobiales bacterium]
MSRRLRVLTWHVHGTYLWYLSHIDHDLYLPVAPGRPPGYGGRTGAWPWPSNVHEVTVDELPSLEVDVVLHQTHRNWEVDRHELLTAAQRGRPQVVLEHDPPRASPTDTVHPVDDPDAVLVHVTPFNALMWDSGRTPTRVIEHGVTVPAGATYRGEHDRGIVVANHLARRGRRLGADVFAAARRHVPLDLVGMGADELGGLGEVPPPEVPAFLAAYRFYLHTTRWTSLGLSLLEAMAVGLPVVGLATTELATVVDDGVTGFVDTDVGRLVDAMRLLLDDPDLAHRMGAKGREVARDRFGIDRFAADWHALLTAL